MSISLHFDVEGGNFVSAGEASESVKMRLKQLGVDDKVVRRVAISLYEAEINMVLHGGGGKVDAEISSDKIEMAVSDTGPGIEDLELAMKEGYSTAPDHIRALGFGAGMGLPNIKKYTDKLEIKTEKGKGTTVYMTVYFD